jgi:hypothetical protein
MKTSASIVVLILIFLAKPVMSQTVHQTVRGLVIDSETQTPLPGATVVITGTNPILGASTDLTGNFKIQNVPLGRFNIQISYIGYDQAVVSGILVTSGKEVVINTGLKQSVNQMNEVTVKAYSRKDIPLNIMASISARSFSVEETRRYAGGVDDPARMASAFAGITTGNLQDNAIVIRGNSPKGVSWRLEGVDIPNPNHFPGANMAGGGIVTVFSSQMLTNSDFYTGAFPAEYGNALAGVFDMKFRTGNSEKKEHTFQLGVLGVDMSSEGPFKKGGKATYLFNYRYSTFGLIQPLLPSYAGLPIYQDLSFKLNFPHKYGSLSVWGIGAIDNMKKSQISDSSRWENESSRNDMDWKLKMGAAGITNKLFLGTRTYINTTVAVSGTLNHLKMNRFDNSLIIRPNWFLIDNSGKIIFSTYLNHKFSKKSTLKTGLNIHNLFYNLDLNSTINNVPESFQNFVKENGYSSFSELYIQSKYDITENISVNSGINANYFTLNGDFSVDPRLSIKWQMISKQSLSFGFGKHSQLEDLKIYLVNKNINGMTEYPNKQLSLSQALHFVAGYDWQISNRLRLKIEPYYQYLYNIPGKPGSSYSLINFTQNWTFRDSLSNNCKGRNYGIDFTLERFLNEGYYYMITASVFKSSYSGDDGIWRNTKFDRGYVANLLFGKELNLKNNKLLGINGRFSYIGGDRISPVLMSESIKDKTVYYDETKAFEVQNPAARYLDLTLTYRINKPKHSTVWALQIKNVLGSRNFDGYSFNYKTKSIDNTGYVVILPVLSYKIEF